MKQTQNTSNMYRKFLNTSPLCSCQLLHSNYKDRCTLWQCPNRTVENLNLRLHYTPASYILKIHIWKVTALKWTAFSSLWRLTHVQQSPTKKNWHFSNLMYENQQHVGQCTYEGVCQWILCVSFLKITGKTSTPNESRESTIKAVYKNNETTR